jgi:hypothetical protein
MRYNIRSRTRTGGEGGMERGRIRSKRTVTTYVENKEECNEKNNMSEAESEEEKKKRGMEVEERHGEGQR